MIVLIYYRNVRSSIMICSNCGSNVDGSKKFCHVCGYPVQQPADENYDSPTEFAELPGNQNINVGYTQSAMADYGYQNSSEALYDKQPKKKNFKKLLIPVIAVVLVVAIALGGWGIFLAANPQVRIARAVEKTLFSAKSFALELSYDGEKFGEGYVSFGKTTFTSDFYAEFQDMQIVCDDGQLLMPIGSSYISADLPSLFAELKEDIDEIAAMIAGSESADVIAEEINERYSTDITPEKVLEWAENLIKNNKINEDVISEIYDTVLIPAISAEFDISEDDIPNYKNLKKILGKAFIKGFNDEALKVTDTERKNGIKYYDVEINIIELEKDMAEYALECKDLESLLEIELGGETVREALEAFVEEAADYTDSDEYDPDDSTVEFRIGIKSGYLVAVEYEGYEATLTEINKKHDAKNDYEELEGEANEVVELDSLEQLLGGFFGGYEEPDYGDYEEVAYY